MRSQPNVVQGPGVALDIADQAHLISQLHDVVHRPHRILLLSLS
ncbi:hypothetical protein [Streptomyces sp. SM1]|nr:hypothetical protein [Streptomyces sp. SM1]